MLAITLRRTLATLACLATLATPALANVISTVAGDGTAAYSGDGGPATAAALKSPSDVTVDGLGRIYFNDRLNHRVRMIDQYTGLISTIAGTGVAGYTPGGGLGTAQRLNNALGISVNDDRLYIADSLNHRIRAVLVGTTLYGDMVEIAGNGMQGFSGDGGDAKLASLSIPVAVEATASHVYITDMANQRVRRVDKSTGIITTFAGNGTPASTGDGGLATDASLNVPQGIAVDAAGNVYIAEAQGNRVRRVDATTGIISTYAGSGAFASSGDGGAATAAGILNPSGLAFDADGNLYISEFAVLVVSRVRMVKPNGIISTVAGNGTVSFGPDGVEATLSGINGPYGLATGSNGDLFIADSNNNRLRKVSPPRLSQTITFSPPATVPYSTDPPYAVSFIPGATATSGLPVFYTSLTPSVCFANGIIVMAIELLGPGTCTLVASQPGNLLYDPAGFVTRNIEVVARTALPVFSTGVDANRVSLPGGSVDPHYTLLQSAEPSLPGPNAIVTSQIADGFWVPQSATSKWIAPSANQSYPSPVPCNAGGTYVYRTTFDLTGFNPASAAISGQWAADNSGTAIRLNGVSLGFTAPGYAPLTAFTIASGFVAGTNTLDFEVSDFGCPNGLRVELSGYALPSPVYQLDVTKAGTGTGTVTSSPAGIDCGANCSASFVSGTNVVLEAIPAGDSHFAGWGGACTGVFGCVVQMDAVQSVTATFDTGAIQTPTVAFSFNPTTVSCGTPSTWTATVSGNAGTPTGGLQLRAITQLVSQHFLSGGVASDSLTFSSFVGTVSLYAAYAGNGIYAGAASPITDLTVTKATPTVVITTSSNPSTPGGLVTMTATVSPSGTCATPNGSVNFRVNGLNYGNVPLDANGVAMYTTTSFTLGSNDLVAEYVGGDYYVAANSATLVQTVAAPIASGSDWNGDGKPDLVWRNAVSGNTYVWYMNGVALASDAFLAGVDPAWSVEGVADFNGDGQLDLVWRNNATGNAYVWYFNGSTFVSDAFLFALPPEWVIQGVADFNADDHPDFLMRNTISGNAFAWFFNNATAIGDQFLFNIDPSWKVEGVADFDLDGQPDLLFRNTTSGLSFEWDTAFTGGVLSLGASSPPIYSIDPVWEVVQAADWNNDGKPDLVFRNTLTGVVFVWYLDGITLAGSDFIVQIDPSWEIVPRR